MCCSAPGCPRLWHTGKHHWVFPEEKWISLPLLCCDFPNQQTHRDFLMNSTFVSKIRPSQNAALGLALSPPSAVLETKGGSWAAELLPGGLVQVFFPSPVFLWLVYLNHEFQVSLCSCDWKKCKIIFSEGNIYGPNFSVQNDLRFCWATPLTLNCQLTQPSFAGLGLNSSNSSVFTWVYQQHQSLCQHSINKRIESL